MVITYHTYDFNRKTWLRFVIIAALISWMGIMSFMSILNRSCFKNIASNLTFTEFLRSPHFPRLDYRTIKFLVEPSGICHLKNRALDMIFVVHSASNHFERRQVLRRTIGNYTNDKSFNYQILFVVGTVATSGNNIMLNLLKESAMYKDLLIIDVNDIYQNLTFKFIGWVKWVKNSCSNAAFVFKMDDDAIVDVKMLENLIWSCYNLTNERVCSQISCPVRHNEPVMRCSDKNGVKFSEYPFEEYPVMCPGLAMIIPSSFLSRILKASLEAPFLWLDDVYLSCILVSYLGEAINDIGHLFMKPNDQKFEGMTKMVGHLKSDSFIQDYEKIWTKFLEKS